MDSSELLLSNVSWTLQLCRRYDVLDLFIMAAYNDDEINWSFNATVDCFANGNSWRFGRIFNNTNSSIVVNRILKWNEFSDKYAQDGTFKIKLNITMDPVLRTPIHHQQYEQISTIFHVILKNINVLNDVYSDKIILRGIRWNILISKESEHLAIYLNGDKNDMDIYWSHMVNATFKVLSWDNSVIAPSKSYQYAFNKRAHNWGYRKYLTWSEFIDPKNKYVLDDTAIIEVSVKVGEPTLTLTHI